MIYQNKDKSILPDAIQVRTLLNKMQDQTPVKHLMPTERVVDGDNKYFLTHLANGRFIIKPNITQQGVLYYGNSNGEEYKEHFKTKYYPSGNNVKKLHDELMYHNVLLEQFALLVKTFPLFKLLDEGIFIPELDINFSLGNPYTLAAAYGLPSPFINLTASKDVAMFYATNEYDADTGVYKPAKEGTLGIVYLYRITTPLGQTSELSTLGVQIFPRTFNTKQFSYVLGPGEEFNDKSNVFGLTFIQNNEASKYYLDMFDGGKKLLPTNDFLTLKWTSIKDDIYQAAVDINLKKNPDDKRDDNIKALKNKIGRDIIEGLPIFTKADLAHTDLESIWNSFLEKIYPLNESDVKIVEYLKQLPSIEEYACYFNIDSYYEKR